MTQHVIVSGYADKSQLLVGGWSQGGYLSYLSSAQLVGTAPWRTKKDDVSTRTGSALCEFKGAAEAGTIPPMLILHGEKDGRVPITQAWGFRRALDEAGLPFEFVTYPREGHHFTERKHIEDLLERVMRFVRAHLDPVSGT
ncbi:Alpha/Beta hydrolase protein [Pseudomassariella vexata]|uniref:Dipeptidyl-peptidase V n=1 Tax=Pseudomassariella vexata TaxID=1141098 RepID=A0A1Y2E2K4_9PEZI|nr:Alpha/Beta hydrolase protein [Pseudomassariella vexata]ORY65781.1 Alpha/Beta hydrolase protein [Pseudomassariella vexata]